MCLDTWTLLQEYGENVQDQNNHVWSKRKYELELQLIALGLTEIKAKAGLEWANNKYKIKIEKNTGIFSCLS